MKQLIVTTVLSLCLGATAFAQTSPETSVSTAAAVPSNWNEEIRDAFFMNADEGRFRSGAEIQENWSSLSAANQSQVRNDCNTIMADNSALTDPNTGSAPSAGGDSPSASPSGDTGAVSPDTTASTTGSAEGAGDAGSDPEPLTSMNALCAMIQDM